MLPGSPARAGIDPATWGKDAGPQRVPPHTRAIGRTFEFTFLLPKPANAGNTQPGKRNATKTASKPKATTEKPPKATKAKQTSQSSIS